MGLCNGGGDDARKNSEVRKLEIELRTGVEESSSMENEWGKYSPLASGNMNGWNNRLWDGHSHLWDWLPSGPTHPPSPHSLREYSYMISDQIYEY